MQRCGVPVCQRRPRRWAMAAALMCALHVTAASASETSPALTLADARRLALQNSEQLAQARQLVAAASADIMAADAGRLPQLAVAGTWTRNLKKPAFFLPPELSGGGGPVVVEMGGDWDLQAAATLTVNLWTAGRLSNARALAAAARDGSRWQESLVADAVVYAVEAAYHGAQLADQQVLIAEQARQLAAEALRVVEAAHAEGRASRFELLRAQVELANREAPLVQAHNQQHLGRLLLARWCGLPADASITLVDDLTAVPAPADADSLLAIMREQSPELRVLEHQVRAAQLAVDLARAGRGPVVQLQGQYALQGQWDDGVAPGDDESAGSASVALAVSLPIFDGFATRAAVQGAEADLQRTRLEHDRILRDRELGVRQAHLDLENALAALAGRHDAVELASEAHRLATVRLENGLATSLERLDAELALTEARVQLAASLHRSNLAAANLKLAVGGQTAWNDPAKETN